MNRPLLFTVVLSAVLGTAPVASADVIGQNERFAVNSFYDAEGSDTTTATLRNQGEHANWYVDDRYWQLLSQAQRIDFRDALIELAGTFDDHIYPGLRELYGSEAIPGVDGDPRVTILLQRLKENSGGYYETLHYYAKSVRPKSNERDMFFMSAESVRLDVGDDLVAHEFQHLISFNRKELEQRMSDDVWLNEARSEYGGTPLGLNSPYERSILQRRASSFLQAGTDSLVEWDSAIPDYGAVSLFIHYIAERFGSDAVARTLDVPQAGVAAVSRALEPEPGSPRFWQVFNDWMVALSLNDRHAGERFGYVMEGLDDIHVIPGETHRLVSSSPFEAREDIAEWEPHWYELSVSSAGEGQSVQVTFDGEGRTTWVASVVASFADGTDEVYQPVFRDGIATVTVPRARQAPLARVIIAVSQGLESSLQNRSPLTRSVTVTAAMVEGVAGDRPVSEEPVTGLVNGDLIRYEGAPNDVYVIWEGYRRYLPPGVLELYGFQGRPVATVSSEMFFGYNVSNYIRTVSDERVFAVRPEGTKHWLDMTEGTFLASGRDPGAIFTVNEAEAAFYRTGDSVTR